MSILQISAFRKSDAKNTVHYNLLQRHHSIIINQYAIISLAGGNVLFRFNNLFSLMFLGDQLLACSEKKVTGNSEG